MRVSIAPVILLASLASALPQQEPSCTTCSTAWTAPAAKREIPPPTPKPRAVEAPVVPRQESFLSTPNLAKRETPTPTPTSTPDPNPKPPHQASNDTAILNALAGTYSLVNTSSTLNGISIPDLPYGESPVGLLIYTATGFMSATITATEPEFRPNLTFPYQANDIDADWAQVGKHSIGYAGPFRVNDELPATETEGQIFHGPLTVANVPTWVGQSHRRNYTVVEVEEEGEVVKYLKIGSERGGGYRGVLWWKRVD